MAQEQVKLDKTRPFGLIYGHPGLSYEQDGIHFSGDETLVERWSTAERISQEGKQAQLRIKREAEAAAQRAREQKLRRALEE